MTILVTLTVAGTDTGPFSIIAQAGGVNTTVASGVTRQQLLDGYSITVPDNTNSVVVDSNGACDNLIVFGTGITTTSTSSTTSTTTSTTTPSPGGINISTGATSVAAACNSLSAPLLVYSAVPLAKDVIVYANAALTIPFNGGLLWYKQGSIAWLIDVDGKITTNGQFCIV